MLFFGGDVGREFSISEPSRKIMFVRLFFYDIKIKVYVVLRKRRRKKKHGKRGEDGKEAERRETISR